ncbi:MAG: hypothetical protein KME49_22535 [Brasilonema octagenarum HA4186-MV1]|jgi:hypothetical protein|nr:hypothetical protein [Brasilonema octagenarum HA4186-MV1]
MTDTHKNYLFVVAQEITKQLKDFSASLVSPDNPFDSNVWLSHADGRKILMRQEWNKVSRITFSSSYDSLKSPHRHSFGEHFKITVAADKSIEAIAKDIKRRLLPNYTAAFEKWREIVAKDIEKDNAAFAGIKEIIVAAGRVPDPDTGGAPYKYNSHYWACYHAKKATEGNGYTPSFKVSSFDGKEFDLELHNIPLQQAKLIAEAFKDL